MSFNGNDIQFLSIPDRVKRLEVSLLKKVLGKYITNPVNLTKVVEDLKLEIDDLEYVENIEWDDDTFKQTITYRDGTTQVIDLPLEQMIVDVTYDNVTKDLTFELNNGNTLVVPLDDIISGLVATSDIANNLNTTVAGKVLDARQGKELDDKKLDKVTGVTPNPKVYGKSIEGSQEMLNRSHLVISWVLVQRDDNGIVRMRSGNTASRPTTNLNPGDQYFNTTTNQMEIYIGDTNHWLYQKYSNGDTLPTPESGTSHTYLVVGGDAGTPQFFISIDEEEVYMSGISTPTTKSGSLVIVANVGGALYVSNIAGFSVEVQSLQITDSDGVKLLRVA